MDRFGLDSQIITLRPLPGHATMGVGLGDLGNLGAQAQKQLGGLGDIASQGQKKLDDAKAQGQKKLDDAKAQGEKQLNDLKAQGKKQLNDLKAKGRAELVNALGSDGELYVSSAEASWDHLKEGDLAGVTVDIVHGAAKAVFGPIVGPFVSGVYASAVDTTKKISKQAVNFLDDVQKQAVGLVADLFNENVCEKGQDKAGKALNACQGRIVSLLGYTGSNADICSFRVGEGIAYATLRMSERKWVYARYVEYGKVADGIRNAAGTKDRKRRGLKDRWKNFPKKSKGEVGPCGLRNIIGQALKTSIDLEKTLEVSKNVDDRRLIFLGFLCKWLPGGRFDAKAGKATAGWCLGMDFIIRDALKAPSLDAYLKKQEASGLTGISQDSARGVADDNIKKKEEAERKAKEAARRAKLDAQIAALDSVRLAAEKQTAAANQQRTQLSQKRTQLSQKRIQVSQPEIETAVKKPSNGTGKLVGLVAAAAGVYFLTKG